jgi:hypothetical protein
MKGPFGTRTEGGKGKPCGTIAGGRVGRGSIGRAGIGSSFGAPSLRDRRGASGRFRELRFSASPVRASIRFRPVRTRELLPYLRDTDRHPPDWKRASHRSGGSRGAAGGV